MINEYSVKISSEKINIEKPLVRGDNYQIMGEIQIREASEQETDDENPDMVYRARWVPPINILDNQGRKIEVKDKRSPSRKLRGSLFFKWNDGSTGQDFEKFYETNINKMILYLDEIIAFLKTKS